MRASSSGARFGLLSNFHVSLNNSPAATQTKPVQTPVPSAAPRAWSNPIPAESRHQHHSKHLKRPFAEVSDYQIGIGGVREFGVVSTVSEAREGERRVLTADDADSADTGCKGAMVRKY